MTVIIVYGHTTLNTPVLVRSPKLNNVGPGQYLDGRLPGNTGCRRLLFLLKCWYEEFKSIKITVIIVYGHTTLNTPVLVRSPKLSNIWPGQYLDGRLPGNTGCRRLLFWLNCRYEEFKQYQNYCDNRLRPHYVEYTGSRPITEVKQRRARSVLGWETAWEYRVP